MALPDDFSPAQHLLDMLLGTHNRSVQKTFLGVPDADLEHPLGGMKVACLLTPDDTVDMIVLRLMLYWFEFKGELPTPIYSIPISEYQSELEIPFKPQVRLIFREDYSAFLAENNLRRAEAQISYRLMHQTSATITPIFASSLALKVKELFSEGAGFTWQKGHVKVVYRDLPNGCYFQLLAESQSEGIRVIESTLELAGISFNEQNIVVANSQKVFPQIPPTQEIYGKLRKTPRKRPLARVRFVRAELHIYGLPSPVVLVDRLGRGNPLLV